MTIDEIVTLIQAVSDNGLTSFVYEEKEEKRFPGSGCSGGDLSAGSSGGKSHGHGSSHG